LRSFAFLAAAFALGILDASARNLVENGEFHSDLVGWDNVGSKHWSEFDDGDDPSSGSIEISNGEPPMTGSFVEQCFAIEGGRVYDIAYSYHSSGEDGVGGRSQVQVHWWREEDCTESAGSDYIDSWATNTWNDVQEIVFAPSDANAASIWLSSFKSYGEPGAPWIVYYDHVFMPEPGATAPLAAFAALGIARRLRR